MTKKLSPDLILKARPANDSKGRPRQQTLIRDKEAPGLVLRVTGQGKKALIYQRRIKGGPLFHKTVVAELQAADLADIGKGNAILAEARATAARFNNWITDGKDPAQEEAREAAEQARQQAEQAKAEQEAEAASKHTLRALLALYCDHLTRQGKYRSAAAARSAFKCHVPAHLAELPAREITRSQVAEIVRRVMEAGKQRQAGVVRAYIHAAFEVALTAESDASAAAAFIAFQIESNPARGIKAIPVKPGNRVLTAAELAAYLEHLDDKHRIDRLLKLALLAGGQRLEMLMRATGADYDPEARQLLLWDHKGKRTTPRAHLLPLADNAAALVAAEVTGPQDFIFKSPKGGRIDTGTPGKRAKEISEAMTGESFDLRDIRRTCETHLAKIGVTQDIRAQLLSHGISGVQARHYDRHGYEKEKRAALERWEIYLLTGLVTPAEVVKLADRRKTT
ncbi:tyrosine-type recombinase/integrase [Desulfurivibrio sp. C05AmB]|uniref:tyrosine-type recombinase/integrase n=1 Tax=Desulfurivibrio sp. C05AmB TaxID=3374371 RepID=UPI00376EB46B